MSRYPFTPELLDAFPEPLAELYRDFEETALDAICSRLKAVGKLNEVTVQNIRALRSHGIELDEIKRAISETADISESRVDELLDDAVGRNRRFYEGLFDAAKLTAPETIVSVIDIDAIRRQTKETLRNLTQSMGFLVDGGRTMLAPADAYQWALDRAVVKVQSGAVSYRDAIRDAVKELADSGIRAVDYESGWTNQIDVAVRRAVMTGVSQICDKYTEQSAELLGTHYYEVSAHGGARDTDGPNGWENHKKWQGKVYSTRDSDIYPNIYTSCGLGHVQGLEGANCRHRRWVFLPGISEHTYTDEELQSIDPPPFEYEGRKYTAYEATQKQRDIETAMRKYKRERLAYKAAGLDEDADAVSARIKRLEGKYSDFSKAAGLREHRERMNIQYIDDASKLKAAKRKVKRESAQKAAEMLQNNASDGIIKSESARETLKSKINDGSLTLTLYPPTQKKHMEATREAGKSYFTISTEELQNIIIQKSGTGEVRISKTGQIKEIIDYDRDIGVDVDLETKLGTSTNRFTIHFSKKRTHAVPAKRKDVK